MWCGHNEITSGPDGKGSCFALASRALLNWSELISILMRGLCLGGAWGGGGAWGEVRVWLGLLG